jgi:hypothetical protein
MKDEVLAVVVILARDRHLRIMWIVKKENYILYMYVLQIIYKKRLPLTSVRHLYFQLPSKL